MSYAVHPTRLPSLPASRRRYPPAGRAIRGVRPGTVGLEERSGGAPPGAGGRSARRGAHLVTWEISSRQPRNAEFHRSGRELVHHQLVASGVTDVRPAHHRRSVPLRHHTRERFRPPPREALRRPPDPAPPRRTGVFVSAAAGGVGSAAGQLARLLGARRVVGSAGTRAKADWLVAELGFDAAFVHRDGPVDEQLAAAAPEGVDVVVENVGGDHLEAAIGALRERGRIAWAGAVSQYDAASPPAAPRNLFDLVEKSGRLEGFLVSRHRDAQAELEEFLTPHLRQGTVRDPLTVTEGFDHVVDAFLGMLRGANTGKAVVRIAS
ncbi:zinc-binding dehydrogenase [Streptomyces koyangensis]